MEKVLLGFLSCGLLGFLGIFITNYFSKKSEIAEAVHKVTQKIFKERVDVIEKKQSIIVVDIKDREDLSQQTIAKIEDIKEKVTEEIERVLELDEIKKIQSEIDTDWDSI